MESILFTLTLLLPLGAFAAANSGSKDCGCYATSSNDFFTAYTFHDFRSLPLPPVPSLEQNLPASADFITGQTQDNIGTLQSEYLQSSTWNESWVIQNWGREKTDIAPTRLWNSLSNVFVERNDAENKNATSMLVLRTKRWKGYQSSAEVENKQKNLLYASLRFRARVLGQSGAVVGLFIYRNGANESDIEILTRDDPAKIRYSNQPVLDGDGNEIQGASAKVDMNTDDVIDGTQSNDKRSINTLSERASDIKRTDWHTHRLDWTNGHSAWFVDGKKLHDTTYGVPRVPSYLVLNVWSDGGQWSGKMEEGGEARLEIEWVEMVYNMSGPVDQSDGYGSSSKSRAKRGDAGCATLCLVDNAGDDGIINGGYAVRSYATKSTGATSVLVFGALAILAAVAVL